MTFQPTVRRLSRRLLPLLILLSASALALGPSAFGSSTGMNSENSLFPSDFEEAGCTSCHGDHNFAAVGGFVTMEIMDADGVPIASGAYEHDATYTINITLDEQVGLDAENRAGFYLRATAGEFTALGDDVQVTGGGMEASHTTASSTAWSMEWTAPAEGAVAFLLLVNDADGSGAADPEDQVYRHYFALTDEHGAQLGAAGGHAEAHYGVSLQQYWIGLIGLAGMILIMLGGYVYLKYANPHNTGPKDR